LAIESRVEFSFMVIIVLQRLEFIKMSEAEIESHYPSSKCQCNVFLIDYSVCNENCGLIYINRIVFFGPSNDDNSKGSFFDYIVLIKVVTKLNS